MFVRGPESDEQCGKYPTDTVLKSDDFGRHTATAKMPKTEMNPWHVVTQTIEQVIKTRDIMCTMRQLDQAAGGPPSRLLWWPFLLLYVLRYKTPRT